MDEMEIFDRAAVRAHRDRAAARIGNVADLLADFTARLLDRLDDTTHRFTHALDLGGRGSVAAALRSRGMHVVSMDASPRLASIAGGAPVAADADLLPFAPGSFDLIVASLSLHWINDLPGALIQLRQALRPDGLFLASLPVLGTLDALRRALMDAEVALSGGASPRISPFADLRDCAAVLQRAGFALPVADVEDIELLYANPMLFLADLRAAGETNALIVRNRRTPPRVLFPAALSCLPRTEGRVRVLLRLACLTGWAPAVTQPGRLAPGSGQTRLAALGKPDRS